MIPRVLARERRRSWNRWLFSQSQILTPKSTDPHRHNTLQTLTVTQLQQVDKLTVLLLTGNPLQSMWEGTSLPANTYFPTLQTLELSVANTSRLQAGDFTPFSSLTTLRLSCEAALHVLGSLNTLRLRLLDTRGCAVEDFSPDLMKKLSQLRAVRGDSYKLCCPQALPEGNVSNWLGEGGGCK